MDINNKEIVNLIAKDLDIDFANVKSTVDLLDDKNTVPFIARYRKEVTGNLDDQIIRKISEKLIHYRNLFTRKEEIKKLIEKQGLLTDKLVESIDHANTLNELEDMYRPFKPKRKTRAMIAIEKGFKPVAIDILRGNIDAKVLENKDKVQGAMDIIAEYINDDAFLRKKLRNIIFNTAIIETKSKTKEQTPYEMYYDFSEPVKRMAGHRILAINRAEKEKFISVKMVSDNDYIVNYIFQYVKSVSFYENINKISNEKIFDITKTPRHTNKCENILFDSCSDSWKRLLFPSIENEIRNHLTETACDEAINIFSKNLKNTLLESPVKNKNVLGFDPAYRTGCKLAVVNKTGTCLATSVIYPTKPQEKTNEAKQVLLKLIKEFNIHIIAIGNGTASGESEIFVSEFIEENNLEVAYTIVNEAGASVYSASELGSKEFPEYDVSLRSAVSIARRLQDPLAELVKIDPSSIGVGLYQHDMNQNKLKDSLGGVVEDCVNMVGVDINTASDSLLSYISGLNSKVSSNIIKYRDEIGEFTSRDQLKKVPSLGAKTFEQCAGFLRIPNSKEVLDNTSIHPESYKNTKKLLKILGYPDLSEIPQISQEYGVEKLAKTLDIGVLTLADIIESISKPGRDPRGDDFEKITKNKPISISDLKENMILDGVVRNVVTFGAFVDIGVHQDGLVHISEISDKYIENPTDVLSAGQKVKVKIVGIDVDKKRISLSMKNISQ